MDDIALAKLIVENVRSYGIIAFRRDGVITAWAAGAEAITGFSRDEALGMSVTALFTEADRAAGMSEAEIETALQVGRAEDSRWHLRRDGSLFWGNGVTIDLGRDGLLAKIFRDETPAKKAEEQRVLLLNELNHRVKNTLATVQSVADQVLRGAGVAREIRQSLTERLIALSRAHNVLVQENWAGADLRSLVCEVLGAYERQPSPLTLMGPTVRLHPSQAVSVSLVCHELATNAAKHGALSRQEGRVEVEWNLAHDGEGRRFLTLLWRERGGPAVSPPDREGFGTKLIRRAFADQKGGSARLVFEPDGLQCIVVLPLRDETSGEFGGDGVGGPAAPAPCDGAASA
ncbi:sensor histidine kinase [Brevundimonas lutea]|uniref:sensor histidine kinase n=1 Tax=Brevundimonas lutea TaxID=2293980 RepID=UPI000F0346FB|nr:HWE histidine kinase domain-containing protein [Brevundimonas lutea]